MFNLIPNNQTTDIIATFVQSLAPLNSAANPFIFCLFSTNVGKYVRYPILLSCFVQQLVKFFNC